MGRRALTEAEKERGRALIDVFKARRDELDLVSEDVANSAGLRIDTLRNLEGYNTFNPGFFTVADIAEVLEFGLDELREASESALSKRKRAAARKGRTRAR